MAHIFVDAHGRELPMGENEPTLYDPGNPALLDNALKPKKPKLFARLWPGQSPSLDAQGPSGATPLTFAAAKGFASDVETLLRHGARPEARDAWGNSALAIAVRAACGGNGEALACVKRLAAAYPRDAAVEIGELWRRALRDTRPPESISPEPRLPAARADGIRSVLQELGTHVPPESAQSALFEATAKFFADKEPIELALAAGADPNQRLTADFIKANHLSISDEREVIGRSALEMAVRFQANPSAIGSLIAAGGDVSRTTVNGESLLHEVKFFAGFDIEFDLRSAPLATVSLLVEAGADINSRSRNGKTLVDKWMECLASEEFCDDIPDFPHDLARLFDLGAAPDRSNASSIHLAIQQPMPSHEGVKLLLNHGASATATNSQGIPVLSCAAFRDHEDVALSLLAAGASPNPSVTPDAAPLMIGAKRGHARLVEALAKAGAHTDVRTEWGATPLSEAASYGQIAAVETLMPYCTDDQIAFAAHAAVHAQSEEGGDRKRLRAVDNLAKRLNREQREPLEAKSHEEMDNLGWTPAEKHRVMPFLSASREERAISDSIGLGKRAHEAPATPAVAIEAAASSAQSSPRPAPPTEQMAAEPQAVKRRGMRL